MKLEELINLIVEDLNLSEAEVKEFTGLFSQLIIGNFLDLLHDRLTPEQRGVIKEGLEKYGYKTEPAQIPKIDGVDRPPATAIFNDAVAKSLTEILGLVGEKVSQVTRNKLEDFI